MLGSDNAIWDDGEWIGWEEINQQIQYKEWGVKYPKADLALLPVFEQLLSTAQYYYQVTGSHLQVHGDIGKLFGAITYGIKLHGNNAKGSDGRLGDDFVAIKTIAPFNNKDQFEIDMAAHFSKLLVVKINAEFEIAHRFIARKLLLNNTNKQHRFTWSDISSNPVDSE